MDCSTPGSSVHGIFQTRVLEWGTIAFSAEGISSLLFSFYYIVGISCSSLNPCFAEEADGCGTCLVPAPGTGAPTWGFFSFDKRLLGPNFFCTEDSSTPIFFVSKPFFRINLRHRLGTE